MSERSENHALKVLHNQRRVTILAGILSAASIYLSAVFGHWPVGIFISIGILLALGNQLFTELSVLRAVESGEEFSKKQYGSASLVRLMGITVVAAIVCVVFWKSGGAAVLGGLAGFHMIVLMAVALPLMKELKKV